MKYTALLKSSVPPKVLAKDIIGKCTVGEGNMIPGWDEILVNMRVGESKIATIPPELGYGERGIENVVPPNATIELEVKILRWIGNAQTPETIFTKDAPTATSVYPEKQVVGLLLLSTLRCFNHFLIYVDRQIFWQYL